MPAPTSRARFPCQCGSESTRQRDGAGPRRRAAHAARAVPARGVRAHRHEDRLRHVDLRRVHGARRRRVGEVVHDARGAGRRRVDHDDRGPRRRRAVAPGADGVPREPRAAVRLLHRRHGDGRGVAARGDPEPDRARRAARPRGQPLSLHRLPQHREVGARRRRADADAPSDPRRVRLRARRVGRRGDRADRRARRGREVPRGRHVAAPADEAAARDADGARRRRAGSATSRTSATPATTSRSARSPATATSRRATCSRANAACCAPSPRRSATTRCATAARSAARSRTAIPRPTCRPRCSRSTRRSSRRARAATRAIAATDFFQGFLETALAPDELLTEIRCRRRGANGFAFEKFNRRAQDWAIVGAVAARVNGGTHVALVNMGSHAAARDRGRDRARAGRVGGRRGARRPPSAPSRPPTSTRRPSTARTSPACSCGARSRRSEHRHRRRGRARRRARAALRRRRRRSRCAVRAGARCVAYALDAARRERSVRRSCVVVSDDRVAGRAVAAGGSRSSRNDAPERGIASSLQAALRRARSPMPRSTAVVVGLADQPLVGAEAYRRVAGALRRRRAARGRDVRRRPRQPGADRPRALARGAGARPATKAPGCSSAATARSRYRATAPATPTDVDTPEDLAARPAEWSTMEITDSFRVSTPIDATPGRCCSTSRASRRACPARSCKRSRATSTAAS